MKLELHAQRSIAQGGPYPTGPDRQQFFSTAELAALKMGLAPADETELFAASLNMR